MLSAISVDLRIMKITKDDVPVLWAIAFVIMSVMYAGARAKLIDTEQKLTEAELHIDRIYGYLSNTQIARIQMEEATEKEAVREHFKKRDK